MKCLVSICLVSAFPSLLLASEDGGGGHSDPYAMAVVMIGVLLFIASVGKWIAAKFGQPGVLGTLVAACIVGQIGYTMNWHPIVLMREGNLLLETVDHSHGDEFLLEEELQKKYGANHAAYLNEVLQEEHAATYLGWSRMMNFLSAVGVILLLFIVGLENSLSDMAKVGWPATKVAVFGVVAPMGLGWIGSSMILSSEPWQVHAFIGATLCATSVGITAQVLKELRKAGSAEAKTILGAAVIDDVLGLVILAVVAGLISNPGGNVTVDALIVISKAAIFLVAAGLFAQFFSGPITRTVGRLHISGLKLTFAVVFCCFWVWLSVIFGLAPIVGAFAAGVCLMDVHFEGYPQEHGSPELELEVMFRPLEYFLVPIFFTLMGLQVKLETFASVQVVVIAAVLTTIAVIGKMACALGAKKGTNRMAIAVGMIPRGEVGLIFASIGVSLATPDGHAILSPGTFSAIVVMVIVTTMITPPLLKMFMEDVASDGAKNEVSDVEVTSAELVCEAVG